jgi:katanin p60 ATPase-containing subunit A1
VFTLDIPLPDKECRSQLLEINLKEIKVDPKLDMDFWAQRLDGYSGADITNICRDAALMTMRRRIRGLKPNEIRALAPEELDAPLTHEDLLNSVQRISPSVSQADVKKYVDWMSEYGMASTKEFELSFFISFYILTNIFWK